MKSVSVCMATFNGRKFIEEQVRSILQQLSASDELVIVDDMSSDGTWEWLVGESDVRVRLFRNERNLGVNQTFARAMSLACSEVILLSDQDDRWIPGRLDAFLGALKLSSALLVSSNSRYMSAEGRRIDYSAPRLASTDSNRHWRNIAGIFKGSVGYYGCAMAFRRELLQLILPIPDYVESHDLWIAMAANIARANLHIDEETLDRRIHGSNVSVVDRPLMAKLRARVIFARSLFELALRVRVPGMRMRRRSLKRERI